MRQLFVPAPMPIARDWFSPASGLTYLGDPRPFDYGRRRYQCPAARAALQQRLVHHAADARTPRGLRHHQRTALPRRGPPRGPSPGISSNGAGPGGVGWICRQRTGHDRRATPPARTASAPSRRATCALAHHLIDQLLQIFMWPVVVGAIQAARLGALDDANDVRRKLLAALAPCRHHVKLKANVFPERRAALHACIVSPPPPPKLTGRLYKPTRFG